MPYQKKKISKLTKIKAALQQPKGRLIATFLIFAIIGGGVFVYQSFADSGLRGIAELNATSVFSNQNIRNNSRNFVVARNYAGNAFVNEVVCPKLNSCTVGGWTSLGGEYR